MIILTLSIVGYLYCTIKKRQCLHNHCNFFGKYYMAISLKFQQRFKELIDEYDLENRTDLVGQIGINYATYTKAYIYGIVPKVKKLMTIADFFKVSIEYLLGINDIEDFEKSKNPQNFSERLQLLLSENNLNIYTFAKNIHIHRNNVTQWIKFDYIPLLDDLITVADYFKVSLDYLVGRTDYK